MPAHEKLNGIQFQYGQLDVGESKPLHQVTAHVGPTGTSVGSMLWSSREIRNVTVSPDQQRRGVATALWQEGHRLAGESSGIPQPKHSSDRTKAGDAWARSVGGRLPRRRQK